MADRTATQPRNGNGSIGQTADVDARIGAGSVQDIEALALTPSDAVAALTERLDRLTQEVAEARGRGEQLEATLERTRRVQQLIGERDRLTSLLAGRDAELQRINRELGALAARAAPPARGSPTLLAAARAVLEKIRPARRAPARARSTPMQTETTQPASAERALLPWVRSGPPKAVLGVVVYGLSETEIASVLEVVERYCAEHDLAPLLLTDNDAFQLFRGRRVLFEFLPARSERERLAPELDWRLFTLRRLALIRRKWQPVRVVAFGRAAAEVVQLWLDSPFEVTPVPALLKGRPEGAGPDWCAVQPEALHP
jgi:hypothetical protein